MSTSHAGRGSWWMRLMLPLFVLFGFVVTPQVARAASDAPVRFQAGDDPDASAIWQKVRASAFGGRTVALAPAEQLTLEAPLRAIDGAVVPVAVRARLPAGQQLAKLYLIVDANPSPMGVIVQLPPNAARTEFETRIRVDAYSHVRAVAETTDGRLLQAVRFVKASGGCSAPPGADLAAARATMGRTALKLEAAAPGQPVAVQLTVQHPNHSGMAMDQLTRQFTPAHFVRKVDASIDGRSVFSADVDFSVSENPHFRFWLDAAPRSAAALRVQVEDSQGLQFDATHPLRAPG